MQYSGMFHDHSLCVFQIARVKLPFVIHSEDSSGRRAGNSVEGVKKQSPWFMVVALRDARSSGPTADQQVHSGYLLTLSLCSAIFTHGTVDIELALIALDFKSCESLEIPPKAGMAAIVHIPVFVTSIIARLQKNFTIRIRPLNLPLNSSCLPRSISVAFNNMLVFCWLF